MPARYFLDLKPRLLCDFKDRGWPPVDEFSSKLHGNWKARIADRVDAPADPVAGLEEAHVRARRAKGPRRRQPRHACTNAQNLHRRILSRLSDFRAATAARVLALRELPSP